MKFWLFSSILPSSSIKSKKLAQCFLFFANVSGIYISLEKKKKNHSQIKVKGIWNLNVHKIFHYWYSWWNYLNDDDSKIEKNICLFYEKQIKYKTFQYWKNEKNY